MGKVVHTDVRPVSDFACSDEMLNKIHEMVLWTERTNLHSVPTDCPQRDERMGWLNDMGVRAEESVYNFNMANFYRKWVRDIADAQDPETGAIPDTVPYRLGSRPADPVSVVYLLAPWLLYRHYGDAQVLEEHYSGMKRWVDFLTSQAEANILSYSWYGDWAPPLTESRSVTEAAPPAAAPRGANPRNTPGEFISTACYYRSAALLAQIASVVGSHEDAVHYSFLADRIKHAFNERFFDPCLSRYATGSQACNAYALYLNLVPEGYVEGVLGNLVQNTVDNEYHSTTGNQCTKPMIEVLTQLGRGDTAYRVMTQTSYPSYGFMIEQGATTVWERWENETGSGMNSHNHPMHAAVDTWFFKYLAGIQMRQGSRAWDGIVIRPHPVGDLEWVQASLQTVRGTISSAWRRSQQGLVLDVTIPSNAAAEVHLPIASERDEVMEGETLIWSAGQCLALTDGVSQVRPENGRLVVGIGSGSYVFTVRRG